jgi:hypothetical protein
MLHLNQSIVDAQGFANSAGHRPPRPCGQVGKATGEQGVPTVLHMALMERIAQGHVGEALQVGRLPGGSDEGELGKDVEVASSQKDPDGESVGLMRPLTSRLRFH